MPTKADDTSALTDITGDWVLFHPVYTPEEVNAVKVRARHTPGHPRTPQV